MQVRVANRQRACPLSVAAMRRVAERAFEILGVGHEGIFEITFVGLRTMRRVNRETLGHDWATDVLSFRYEGARGEPDSGELIIAPAMAERYAGENGIAYGEELRRYVLHGILHWNGLDDGTPAERKRMRREEDRLLKRIGGENPAAPKRRG